MKGRPFEAQQFEPSVEEKEALAALGLVRIPMDIPWPVEPVNVLLVQGERPALIDTGLHYLDNITRLETALASVGLQIEDLQEIWLTHPHPDHFGLTHELVRRSGAEVMAFSPAVQRFQQYETFWNEDLVWVGDAFLATGVPAQLVEQMRLRPSHTDKLGQSSSIDRTFEDGEQVRIAGRAAEVLHVPGHSPWCCAFWFSEEKWLASGDALLERITSNPIFYPPTAGHTSWQGLPAYRRSIRRLAQLPAERIVPGHARSFQGHAEITERMLAGQLRRQERIVSVMQKGAKTPYAIAEALFGAKRAAAAVFLVMSEVLRHLDWLVAEEKAVIRMRASQWTYELLSP